MSLVRCRDRAAAGKLFLVGGFFRNGARVRHLPLWCMRRTGSGIAVLGVGVEVPSRTSAREYATQAKPHTYTTIAIDR
ncbi:MAG: hypothetical protein ABI877_13940 [Gemmatimonadaceae bacterium]